MGAVRSRDVSLTDRFLTPELPALTALFFEIRAETDAARAASSPALYGKPYPYGYCREITCDVLDRLRVRLEAPSHPGEHAIKAYLRSGGVGRMIWGVLRERFFQNAFQLGDLYIDVSNDTVDVAKPKVEILPIEDSGFAAVRDIAHFARIASAYWNVTFYANHAVPALAPIFPIIGVNRSGAARLYPDGKSMIDLLCASGFALSERWLIEGPPASPAVTEAIRARCAVDARYAGPQTGLAAALEACRTARALRLGEDPEWKVARTRDLVRLFDLAIPIPGRG